MNDYITTFLNSGFLEKYVEGTTTLEETKHVENYIATYPEVKQAYKTLQLQLELVHQTKGVKAPESTLRAILEAVNNVPVITLPKHTLNKWRVYGVAASVAALLFAGTSFFLYGKYTQLKDKNQLALNDMQELRMDVKKNDEKLKNIVTAFGRLNGPETEKYILTGNDRAKDLKTVAYINPKDKTALIDIVSLPQLPEEQCYQIWAELEGKMVSLGILSPEDRRLKPMPYTEDALGLNITIEQKGKATTATLENLVAETTINRHN